MTQALLASVFIGGTTALFAVLGAWYDYDVRFNGESVPPALFGLAASIVGLGAGQVLLLIVLSVLAFSRVKHVACGSCGQCYCCRKCNDSSDIWFWLFIFSGRSQGSNSSGKSSDSSSSKSGDTNNTILLAVIAAICLFFLCALIILTSAMLVSEIFYWRAKNHFEVYGEESDDDRPPNLSVPADDAYEQYQVPCT